MWALPKKKKKKKKKKVNETVARLRSETGIITANLHKVAEDL